MVRAFERARTLLSLGLLGMLVFSSGCGSSSGESNLTPETPPPGQSAQEQLAAQKKAFGPRGQLPKQGQLPKEAAPKKR
jgi:hypothetical protein